MFANLQASQSQHVFTSPVNERFPLTTSAQTALPHSRSVYITAQMLYRAECVFLHRVCVDVNGKIWSVYITGAFSVWCIDLLLYTSESLAIDFWYFGAELHRSLSIRAWQLKMLSVILFFTVVHFFEEELYDIICSFQEACSHFSYKKPPSELDRLSEKPCLKQKYLTLASRGWHHVVLSFITISVRMPHLFCTMDACKERINRNVPEDVMSGS